MSIIDMHSYRPFFGGWQVIAVCHVVCSGVVQADAV